MYYDTGIKCSIIKELLKWIPTAEGWTPCIKVETLGFTEVITPSDEVDVPNQIMRSDPFFKRVSDSWYYRVYRFAPNYFYPLHVDNPSRRVCFNVQLEDNDATVFFVEKGVATQVEYQTGNITLLDVTKPHAILTKSQERYILTANPRAKIDPKYTYEFLLRKFKTDRTVTIKPNM